MVKLSLNDLFSSLSDTTRRGMLQQLLRGEQTITQLAEAYRISLPAVSKHVKVLETSGLVIKEKRGRQWFVRLSSSALNEATRHLLRYEATLNNRLDSFKAYLEQKESASSHESHSPPQRMQQTILVKEILAANPATVWAAYTEPSNVRHWWSVPGAELLTVENDIRVGGCWRFTVCGIDGNTYELSGIYTTVEYPFKLVYTDGLGDPSKPRPEAHVTILFEQLPDGTTLLTKESLAFPAVHQLNAAWYQVIGGGR